MLIGEGISDPAARTLDVEGGMPAPQMVRLQMQETSTRPDEENDPNQSPRHAQARVKKFRSAKSEQNRRQKVCGGTDQLIANSRDNRTHRADEILRRLIRRRNMAEPKPGRHIFGRVGNQRKKQQCAGEKQDE